MSYEEFIHLTDEQLFALCMRWERARQKVKAVLDKEKAEAFKDQFGDIPEIPKKSKR